ncbi:DUF397 domain-containing protein [Umezawaea endophytica]|uniref:DUF397 domain-containing protein n=1 Tax=Umezawaea endophytica TaxID=1654476 RepID=A0A9X3A7E2_9PSEU|nr:DUF397 domain-containing protein [Umezawaea endophytica]MCS7484273.1 DUF397 domain-containing protein [Umezawaea endophytica]
MSELVWRKSSYSGGGGTECVEVALPARRIAFRDSKNPFGPVLTFPRTAEVPGWTREVHQGS